MGVRPECFQGHFKKNKKYFYEQEMSGMKLIYKRRATGIGH